jgi:hypothetical protein
MPEAEPVPRWTTLGAVSERIPVAISWESMKAITLSGDHL